MAGQSVSYFHLHLVSDATGETLSAMARASVARYANIRKVEHLHVRVRTLADIYKVAREVEKYPGMVLYTIISRELSAELEERCLTLSVPCVDALKPLMGVMDGYLGARQTGGVGAQYALDDDYFRRIEAVNYTISHDDGQNIDSLDQADIILVGVSRTSKTPTSIYLANRGLKTANVPIISELPLPKILLPPDEEEPDEDADAVGAGAEQPAAAADEPEADMFIVGLIASPERISSVREKRAQTMPGGKLDMYVDREVIAREIDMTRKLCGQNGWPLIDVTRRSIEETAAAVLDLYKRRHDQ